MLFMMAWLLWFLGNDVDDDDHNEEGEPDVGTSEAICSINNVEENGASLTCNEICAKKSIRREISEENIVRSIIHVDESEMDYNKIIPKFPVQEEEITPLTENFEESPIEYVLDHGLELESFPMEEEMPTTISLNAEYESSIAVTSDNEEVLKAAKLRNRMSSLIEHQGRSELTGSPSSSKIPNADTAADSFVIKEDDIRMRHTTPYIPEPVTDDHVVPINVIFETSTPHCNKDIGEPIQKTNGKLQDTQLVVS